MLQQFNRVYINDNGLAKETVITIDLADVYCVESNSNDDYTEKFGDKITWLSTKQEHYCVRLTYAVACNLWKQYKKRTETIINTLKNN